MNAKFQYFFCSEEYLFMKGSITVEDGRRLDRVEAVSLGLNQKGQEGWELVTVHISQGSPHYTFKRLAQ